MPATFTTISDNSQTFVCSKDGVVQMWVCESAAIATRVINTAIGTTELTAVTIDAGWTGSSFVVLEPKVDTCFLVGNGTRQSGSQPEVAYQLFGYFEGLSKEKVTQVNTMLQMCSVDIICKMTDDTLRYLNASVYGGDGTVAGTLTPFKEKMKLTTIVDHSGSEDGNEKQRLELNFEGIAKNLAPYYTGTEASIPV